MTLHDFPRQIDSSILGRGLEYFENELVLDLKETKPANWESKIKGSKDYNSVVQLGPGEEIQRSSCNCPYDSGPICKHIIATFYAIKKEKGHLRFMDRIKTPGSSKPF